MTSSTPVLDLLRDPSKWTKGSFARDEWSNYAPTHSELAVSFCLRGAVLRCYPSPDKKLFTNENGEFESKEQWEDYLSEVVKINAFRDNALQRLRDVIVSKTSHGSIAAFNDHSSTKHADILRVLELAEV